MKTTKYFQMLTLSLFVVLGGISVFVTDAEAISIRVSQESAAGAGDFDANVLGSITSFDTALSASAFYQYGAPNAASYNGELNGGPNPISSLTQLFLINGSDGLSLAVVHDNPNDGTGGTTQTRWNLTGDTGAFVVVDDPGEGVAVSAGNTQFDSNKNWIACCTDGYAIGSLDGNWAMFGQFLTTPTGITSWQATTASGGNIPLTLAPGRRVRLDTTASMPEPGTILLFGSGLAGFGLWRWKKGQAA